MSIWNIIKRFVSREIHDTLHAEEAYFPMLVPNETLVKEATHVEGFAPEVAWVTRAGRSPLARALALRPTSEAVIHPYMARWIRSHRDLPLRLNQWCNVIRWEFSCPMPFIRTREFLWQEGHTAHATQVSAEEEVGKALSMYRWLYEEILAVPVIPGRKTEREKFAGADYTKTVEAFIACSGRAVQAATAHYLGQNFAKMYDVQFEDEAGRREYAYQNSWGVTTRAIGVAILVHGDDKGLVLPPKISPIQAIVIPIPPRKGSGERGSNATSEAKAIFQAAVVLSETLEESGIRSQADGDTGRTPGWKYHEWELKGVPIRVEIGPRDLAAKSAVLVRRDNGQKKTVKWQEIGQSVEEMLKLIQRDMLLSARAQVKDRIRQVSTWEEFLKAMDDRCLALAPCSLTPAAEQMIRERSSEAAQEEGEVYDQQLCEAQTEGIPVRLTGAAKALCIPFDQPSLPSGTRCIGDPGKEARKWVLFGRSY
ncbi:hypothetical protein AAMO2058_000583700 [Amorphochlora amoebiformis]